MEILKGTAEIEAFTVHLSWNAGGFMILVDCSGSPVKKSG